MDKDVLTISLRPFVLKQQILIHKGNTVTIQKYNLDELEEKCYELCKMNNIHKIYLTGPRDYALKIKEQINNTFTKYNNNNIKVIIMT